MGPSGWDPEYYEKFAELNLAFGPNCDIYSQLEVLTIGWDQII